MRIFNLAAVIFFINICLDIIPYIGKSLPDEAYFGANFFMWGFCFFHSFAILLGKPSLFWFFVYAVLFYLTDKFI
jgi:hypothetical protein